MICEKLLFFGTWIVIGLFFGRIYLAGRAINKNLKEAATDDDFTMIQHIQGNTIFKVEGQSIPIFSVKTQKSIAKTITIVKNAIISLNYLSGIASLLSLFAAIISAVLVFI